MRTLMMILALAVLVVGFAGCNSSTGRSVGMNTRYLCDDTQRALGLDRPSMLHPRDLVSVDERDPYRAYD